MKCCAFPYSTFEVDGYCADCPNARPRGVKYRLTAQLHWLRDLVLGPRG